MADKLRVGVVGLGLWGQNHPLVYADYHRCELAVVCDLDEDRARAFGETYRCDWTTDVGELAASDVTAFSVATPDHAHFAPAMTLLRAGKHVLIEKPMTTDLGEAKALARAARESGALGMVDFHLRWSPQYLTVKAMAEAGELGEAVMGYIRLSDAIRVAQNWLSWAGRSGPQWFLFPHTMDLMRWILDADPVDVYAVGRKGLLASQGVDTWDAIQALVRFPASFVTFETSWIVPDSSPSVIDCHMSLYGTAGKVEYDQDYAGLEIATDRFSYPWMPVGQRNRYGKLDSFLYEPMRHFVDCVVEGRPPTCSLEDGVVNTAMIAATMRSVETGQRVSIADLLADDGPGSGPRA